VPQRERTEPLRAVPASGGRGRRRRAGPAEAGAGRRRSGHPRADGASASGPGLPKPSAIPKDRSIAAARGLSPAPRLRSRLSGLVQRCAGRRRSCHRMPAGKRPVLVAPVPVGAGVRDAGPLTPRLKHPHPLACRRSLPSAPVGGAQLVFPVKAGTDPSAARKNHLRRVPKGRRKLSRAPQFRSNARLRY